MKMDYASSSSEKRAHDLLAPLVGACPDSVWEVLNVELEARRLKARSNWLNNISISPKVPLMVAGAITVITLSVWGITSFMHAKHNSSEIAAKNNQAKPVAVQHVNATTNSNNVVIQSAAPVQPVAKIATDNNTSNNNQDNNTALVKTEKHKKHIDSLAIAPVAQGQAISIKQDENLTLDMHGPGDADANAMPLKTHRTDSTTSAVINRPSTETVVASDEQ